MSCAHRTIQTPWNERANPWRPPAPLARRLGTTAKVEGRVDSWGAPATCRCDVRRRQCKRAMAPGHDSRLSVSCREAVRCRPATVAPVFHVSIHLCPVHTTHLLADKSRGRGLGPRMTTTLPCACRRVAAGPGHFPDDAAVGCPSSSHDPLFVHKKMHLFCIHCFQL